MPQKNLALLKSKYEMECLEKGREESNPGGRKRSMGNAFGLRPNDWGHCSQRRMLMGALDVGSLHNKTRPSRMVPCILTISLIQR